jgi:hypothetical protein
MLNHRFLLLPEEMPVDAFPLLGGTFLTQLVRMEIELPDPTETINW